MARILFAWELGAGYGHLGRLQPVAAALQARGHVCVFAVRDPHRAHAILAPRGFAMLQAPIWRGATPSFGSASSYAGVMRRVGFHAAPALAGQVACWRGLLGLVDPDLILMEHAPTAMLAAQIEGRRSALIGTGWSLPPIDVPLPALTPLDGEGVRRQLVAEAQVLTAINLVRREARLAPLGSLAALFAAEDSFLCTFPELDHYAPRPGGDYLGALEQPVAAQPPAWPADTGPRVFAFLDAARDDLADIMAGLARSGLPTLAHVRDLASAQRRSLSGPSLAVAGGPVDLSRAAAEAAVVVCQGGHGTLAAALLAGRPLLLLGLPRHNEQRLIAERLTAAGLALSLPAGTAGASAVSAAVGRLVREPGFAEAARGFARRHGGHDARAAAAIVADRCEAILARPAAAVPVGTPA